MSRPGVLAAGLLIASAAAALLLGVGLQPHVARAEDETVTAIPVPQFMGAAVGQRVQQLIWRGGLELKAHSDTFGGLSGLTFIDDDGRLVMVSDRGRFVSGQLIYDEQNRPLSLVGVTSDPIQNSKGAALPRAYTRDAEAIAAIVRDGATVGVRVGFENLTRVADFSLVGGTPQGAAREVNIPGWLSETRTNQTLEAVCIAPAASPIAGSTLLLTEGVIDDDGLHQGWLLGRNDRGPLSYQSGVGTDPTDCAFLPNGDLLVLERGIALLSFRMRLQRVPAAEVRPGGRLTGQLLIESSGNDIDNMEGVAVHQAPDGTTRITIISDNNFNDWQRSLLLEFSLPDEPSR